MRVALPARMQPLPSSLSFQVVLELRRDLLRLASALDDEPRVARVLRGFALALPIGPATLSLLQRLDREAGGGAIAVEPPPGARPDAGGTLCRWPPPFPAATGAARGPDAASPDPCVDPAGGAA